MGPSRRLASVVAAAALSLIAVAVPTGAVDSPASADEVPVSPRAFAPRSWPTVAAFDGRLFVFGGFSDRGSKIRSDGALFDPETARVRRVDDWQGDPLLSSAAVATGKRMVILGFACARTYRDEELGDLFCEDGRFVAAELNSATGGWKTIRLPGDLRAKRRSDVADTWWPKALGTLSDGRAVFATVNAVPAGGSLDYTTQYWVNAPTTRQWTAVPDPPAAVDGLCLAGNRIVALTSATATPSLLVFDANSPDQWTTKPSDPAVQLTDDPRLSCMDNQAMVTGLRQAPPTPADILAVAVVNVDHGTWVQVSPPGYPEAISDPRRGVALLGPGLWTGTELVFAGAAYAYNPAARSWRELDRVPPGDQPLTVWTGSRVAGYVVASGGDLGKASVFSYPVG